jgi:hypothetical protein
LDLRRTVLAAVWVASLVLGARLFAQTATPPNNLLQNLPRPTVQRMQPLTIVDAQPGAQNAEPVSQEALDVIEETKAKKRCIPADFIREAVVKDDKRIDLTLSGKKYYAIKFKDKCHGLGFDRSFYYYLTPARQLCARFDSIVTRSGSRCIIDKISKRDAPKSKKSKDEKKKKKD